MLGVATGFMFFAANVAKPIEAWRQSRDGYIAAADIEMRKQNYIKAVRFLARAAELSSKIDEEDRSIELMTKVNQIQEKAIKMRKAEAAKKAQKQLDRESAKTRKKGQTVETRSVKAQQQDGQENSE
jgi:hypothetical protein